MTSFNVAEIHSIGMYALSTALDRLMEDETPSSEALAFREAILEQFELNFYRCLVHSCPEHNVSVSVDGVKPQLLFD